MASAIEDAGFEVRDMIEWVYGCLSEDTEVLTKKGFKLFHKTTGYYPNNFDGENLICYLNYRKFFKKIKFA